MPTNSLERALVLLQLIAKAPGGMSNVEICRELSIPPSTCSYILSRLKKEGYLSRHKNTGKYRIGLKNLILGRTALREVGFRTISEPTLYRLATDTGLAANLAVLEGSRVVLVDRVEGPAFVKAAVEQSAEQPTGMQIQTGFAAYYQGREYRDVGSELPVFSTALGSVLLANLSQTDRSSFLEQNPPRQPNTIVEFLTYLEKIDEQGYCLVDFEPHNESCALAAPIFGAKTVRAAVSVSCRRHLPAWKNERALSELVKEAAWEISCRLQYPGLVKGHSAYSTSAQGHGGFRMDRPS